MLQPQPFTRFQPAYVSVLRQVLTGHRYQTFGRGKDALEIINCGFSLADPVDRVPYLAARGMNLPFNFAEALWYLTGRDDLDMIAYYAPSLRNLSPDGATLTGTAYGPRLFRPNGPDGRSQYERVLRLLREESDSKRAAMIIMQPDELADPANPDVACTLSLQFMLREGQLHMTAYMRGNDALIGLLGDTFSFTLIQEFAARELRVAVGQYAHYVGSMHINKLDIPKVTAIIDEVGMSGPRTSFPPDVMPRTTWEELLEVCDWEQRLRLDQDRLTPERLHEIPLDPYWRRVLALFEVYRQIKHSPDTPVSRDSLAELHPGHRWLVAVRWPSYVPATAEAVGA
ncbi:thymidylate synthase [Micromonospora sp. RV43]|uniref:thymidylate synthase n=1 Tax=Micromonospora sp. RV43 TaxID=1661387 RepID=UPI00064C14AB|nr:thymidylate synthase [Micromonospora sp. RV43]